MSAPDVFIAGAFVTPFGKFVDRPCARWPPTRSPASSPTPARTPDDVDAVFFANAAEGYLTGQECIRGQVALQDTGLLGKSIVNVENACASGSTAFQLACAAVAVRHRRTSRWRSAPRSSPTPTAPRPSPSSTRAGTSSATAGRTRPRRSRRSWTSTRRWRAHTWSAPARRAEDFARISVKSHECGALEPQRAVPRAADRRRGAGEPRDLGSADAADVLADRRRRGRGHRRLGRGPRAPRRRPRPRARVGPALGRPRNGGATAPSPARHRRPTSEPASGRGRRRRRGPRRRGAGRAHRLEELGIAEPGEGVELLRTARPRWAGACRSTRAAACSAAAIRSAPRVARRSSS